MATAYAELEDVLAFFSTPPKGARLERLDGLLGTAAEELNGELRRDYYRHPTTGEATWLVDGEGGRVLHLHRGIVSLSLVEISLDRGQTFVELAATDWLLKGDSPTSSDAPPDGEPYFHLVLTPYATYTTWPVGDAVIRLTGAYGWSTPPRPLIEGNAERVRQIAFADPSYQGFIPVDEEGYGRPMVSSGRWPDVLYKFMQRENDRFYACEA